MEGGTYIGRQALILKRGRSFPVDTVAYLDPTQRQALMVKFCFIDDHRWTVSLCILLVISLFFWSRDSVQRKTANELCYGHAPVFYPHAYIFVSNTWACFPSFDGTRNIWCGLCDYHKELQTPKNVTIAASETSYGRGLRNCLRCAFSKEIVHLLRKSTLGSDNRVLSYKHNENLLEGIAECACSKCCCWIHVPMFTFHCDVIMPNM